MKRNKYIGYAMMAAGLFAATSCSDFSDYNEAPADALASGNQTLWENIQQNGQLKQFAALLQRVGFDTELQKARTYTVWAPLDGSYDAAVFQQMSDSLLLQQFVKSHVADYSHAASGAVDERVHALNEKSFVFQGNGAYKYDGIDVTTPNLPSSNGLLHLLGGAAQFYPNLYEYLSMGQDIDSLRNYFLKYEQTRLNEQESVKGPIIGGVQTYIDSVVVTTNSLLNDLRASIANEDSSYTFIMPTNRAYMDMYEKVRNVHNFVATTVVQDVENYASASATDTKSLTINVNYLRDSLARQTVAQDLIFSNNDGYNKWLLGQEAYTDTLRSTTRNKLSNPQGTLLAQQGQKLEMSNGQAYLVDSLAYYPWESWNPEIDVNPMRYMAKAFSASTANVNVSDPFGQVFGPEITEFSYVRVYPTNVMYGRPDIFITLPNVRSTTYNFYCVFLPASVTANTNALPNALNFQLSYCTTRGALATYTFSRQFVETGKGENPTSTPNMNTAFMNDPLKTDTVFLGQFTFPVAYHGLTDADGNPLRPNIRITTPSATTTAANRDLYTRDVCIAAIILKPVELDEYEAKNKEDE